MAAERWLPVVGHENAYEVSDRGRVRSLDRTVRLGFRPQKWLGRVLKVWQERTGRGRLYRYVDIQGRNRKVAVLMLEAFVGPRPFPKAHARHLNDDSLDDRLENLEWGTAQQNADDMIRNERQPRGERNGGAKLTEADVLAIRAAVNAGAAQRAVAKLYGVHPATISHVVTRRTWWYLP